MTMDLNQDCSAYEAHRRQEKDAEAWRLTAQRVRLVIWGWRMQHIVVVAI
jgi:hypothetical protein